MSTIPEAKKRSKKFDEFVTPAYAVIPLAKYIKPNATIWECTGYNSIITQVFKHYDHKVVETHINNNFDFLKDKPDFDFDVIVTNPPYSIKDEFIAKCYEYKKPFALLLPITAFEGIPRGKMFAEHGIEIMIFNRRVEFTGGGVWFAANWFCWNILPEKLVFIDLDKKATLNQSILTDFTEVTS